ncbi:TIGR02147 family protein [Pseudobdellovibrio sp. HCB154]|uniref:TIGR02147 family protein n=1 Tax=Pseudobdellovibrio sp. HCB154 TaxID=3386277 RepID=UPI0039175902
MISIYQFDSYKKFFNKWVEQQANKGHGEYRRLAMALNVSTTLISQIFNAEKELSMELACEMVDYLHLNEDEGDYFLLLVEVGKSGSIKLRNRLLRQIKERQDKARKLENRLKKDHTLDEQAKQIYFSSWLYPALRILSDIPEINTAEQISERLQVPKNHVLKALDFLIKHQIIMQKGNKLSLGPAHIYLPPSDPLASRNMMNWRQLGFNKMQMQHDDQFFYSGTYALSEAVAEEIRKRLPHFVEEILKEVKPSPSETTRCLNIDFFQI